MDRGVKPGRRVGLLVNPIAGMGGRVGLKGTDGPDALEHARELGAVPISGSRAEVALTKLVELAGPALVVVTPPGPQGEEVARRAGVETIIVTAMPDPTGTSADSVGAARKIAQAGVDLLLFAGGDGTARDIAGAIGLGVPVIGIPTGVKMHSSVFAINPRAAGEVAARFLASEDRTCHEAEVMDIDEQAFREGHVAAKLYGYLRIPNQRTLVQGLKSGSGKIDQNALGGIAAKIGKRMGDGALWIVGPGSTTRTIAIALGLEKTLLGVDLYRNGTIVKLDANERDILRLLDGTTARIVVTPIGGQGYLFGRGNQQISPEVIRRVGKQNIVVVATTSKLADLAGAPFLVDTGDPSLDEDLSGYIRVLVGRRQEHVHRIA